MSFLAHLNISLAKATVGTMKLALATSSGLDILVKVF